MQLVRLVYASRASQPIGRPFIEEVLAAAERNNGPHAITGLLCVRHDSFLQVLEGSASAVNLLFCKIVRDPRHASVRLFEYSEIVERDFPDWNMGYVGLDELSRSVLLRFFASSDYDPFSLNQARALGLLRALRSHKLALITRELPRKLLAESAAE